MDSTTTRTTKRFRFAAATVLVALALTLVAGIVPNAVTAQAATDAPVFVSKLATGATAGQLATADPALSFTAQARTRTATVIQPVVVRSTSTRSTSTRSTSSGSTSTDSGAAPAGDETAQAQAILAGLIGQYPILAGTTVSFGDAHGAQAIAYYKSGRIVISPDHTASLTRILNHEIWHVIDWRDNGVIDWYENVPPK